MDGYVVIGTEVDTKDFDSQIKYIESQLDEIEYKLKQADMGFEVGDTQKLEAQYEKLTNQLIRLRNEQQKLNGQGFNNIMGSVNSLGNSMENLISKVARWGLAVIGVRSAYMGIRRAISLVSAENEGIQGQIDVMKSAIASALLPVVQTILNVIAKIMIYINYIYKTITGKNLFNFDKAFKSAKKNSAGTAKNLKSGAKFAKEINKQLAGFDEMNVLTKNTQASSGGGAGVGGVSGGDIAKIENPFEGWEDTEIPEWVKKITKVIQAIIKFGQFVIDNWLDVIGLLSLTKLVIDLFTGNWVGVVIDLIIFLVTQLPRLVEAVGKVIEAIWDLLKMGASWIYDNVIVPIGNSFVVLWIDIKKGVSDLWNGVVNIVKGIGNWIYKTIIKPVADFFVKLWNGIKSGVKDAVDFVKSIFKTVIDFFGGLVGKILGFFKEIGVKVGDVISSAFKGVVNGVLGAIEKILNFPIRAINKLIKTINKIPGINLGTLDTFDLPRLAKGGIINQPGRGVAIGGERGKEGVIPLTDSQQMALLGEAIGKYITVNANIINTMNGKVISKELKKVQNGQDFAYNR